MTGVGFAGLGRMGQAMAPRLAAAGFDLAVWNRSPGVAIEGARAVQAPADLWQGAGVVLCMLRDAGATAQVIDALGQRPGGLVCDMATHAPADTLALAERTRALGLRYAEAPVGGTVAPARAGQLIVFAAGDDADLDELAPLLAPLARVVHQMGPVGAGARMKMAMNLLLTVWWQGLSEALALAEAGGLDRAQVLDVLADSPAATPALAVKRAILLGQPAPVGFDLAGVLKDMRAVSRTLADGGLPAPAAAGTFEAVAAAVAAGFGAQDVAELARFRRLAGVLNG